MGVQSAACRDRRPGGGRPAADCGPLMSGAEDHVPHAVNPDAATGRHTEIDAAQESSEGECARAEVPGKGLAVR
jgi:hypothetical protein